MDNFVGFINSFKLKKNDSRKPTHTIMPDKNNKHIYNLKWGGAYYVDNDNIEFFNNKIEEFLNSYPNANLSITESFGINCPLIIDIDLLYEKSENNKRYYTDETTYKIIGLLWPYITKYFKCNHKNKEECWITEKVSPSIKEKTGELKDGLHIIFPNFIGDSKIIKNFMKIINNEDNFTEKLLDVLKTTSIDNKLPINNVNSIIDSNVQRWFVYGCGKPSEDGIRRSYLLTKILNAETLDEIENNYTSKTIKNKICLLNKFENNINYINNIDNIEKTLTKSTSTSVFSMWDDLELDEVDEDYNPYNNNQDKKEIFNKLADNEYDSIKNKVLKCLSIERASEYETWLKVGMCLFNIGGDSLLDLWKQFSLKYPRYKNGESKRHCDLKWKGFKESGLTIGSLNHWAKLDNLKEYMKIIEESLTQLIQKSITRGIGGGHHDDIAEVVYNLYKEEYICVDLKDGWYYFNGNKWVECKKGYRLQECLTKYVKEIYYKFHQEYKKKMDEAKDKEDDIASGNYDGYQKAAYKIYENLKNVTFQENIMKACRIKFYKEDIMKHLDSNPMLLGFENCVFDLERNELREGRPDDYLTMTTEINMPIHQKELPLSIDELNNIIKERVGKYTINEGGKKEWNYNLWDNGDKNYYNKIARDIITFFNQILPDKDLLKYCLRFVACRLCGMVMNQRFSFWTGSGGNGKSILMDLIRETFGQYCTNLPVTLLTQKRKASNAASPEKARTRGVRLCYMQEPDSNERINAGEMKELSGGDMIQCRKLYSDPFEFKPMFEIVLMCNEKPTIDDKSNGAWRRVQVYPFVSKFVDDSEQWDINTNKENNIYPRNKELSNNLKEWPIIFMGMLLKEWEQMGGVLDDNDIPNKIRYETDKYKNQNDIIGQWIKDELVECGGGSEDVGGDGTNDSTYWLDLYRSFLSWSSNLYSNLKINQIDVRDKLIEWQKNSKYGFSKAINKTEAKARINLRPIQDSEDENDDE